MGCGASFKFLAVWPADRCHAHLDYVINRLLGQHLLGSPVFLTPLMFGSGRLRGAVAYVTCVHCGEEKNLFGVRWRGISTISTHARTAPRRQQQRQSTGLRQLIGTEANRRTTTRSVRSPPADACDEEIACDERERWRQQHHQAFVHAGEEQ